MTNVTQILRRIEQGDTAAAHQRLPRVYDELRKLAGQWMAQENPLQTLQATALVHEAYLRLVDVDQSQRWDSRGHFFAAAAEAMRRILVEQARRKGRVKHGGRIESRQTARLRVLTAFTRKQESTDRSVSRNARNGLFSLPVYVVFGGFQASVGRL